MLKTTRLALAFCAMQCFAVNAQAATHLESSTPKNEEILTTPPTAVMLNFSQAVIAPESGIKVYASSGKMVNDGKAVGYPATPNVLATGLPANLPKDEYTVQWKAVSASADHTETRESFIFMVK